MTQMQMAARCGKDQAFVSALVNGKVPIPAHDFDRFADLLGIPVSDLVAAEDGSMWSPDEHALFAQLHESPSRDVLIKMIEAALRQENKKDDRPSPETRKPRKVAK